MTQPFLYSTVTGIKDERDILRARQPQADQDIARNAKDILRKEFEKVATDVTVRVFGKCVFLQGQVRYPSQRMAIGLRIMSMEGIKGVCNLVRVCP